MRSRSPAWGWSIAVVGLVLAAWVSFGRALFGIAGSLAPVYAATLGLVFILLNVFIARAFARTAKRGFRHRPSTLATLYGSWASAVLLGFAIPDATATGLQTILTGGAEPGLGMAIGFANPLGVLTLGLAIAALILARGDALGRADGPREEEEAL